MSIMQPATYERVMALAKEALETGDANTLYRMLEKSHEDIAALMRLQAVYAGMEGKSVPSGDLETVKTIAMEAMSMAKMIIQAERRTP